MQAAQLLQRFNWQLFRRYPGQQAFRLILGKRGRLFGLFQVGLILRADPLAGHAAEQAVVPGSVDPGREGDMRRALVVEDQAALGAQQEAVGGDRPAGAAPLAGAAS